MLVSTLSQPLKELELTEIFHLKLVLISMSFRILCYGLMRSQSDLLFCFYLTFTRDYRHFIPVLCQVVKYPKSGETTLSGVRGQVLVVRYKVCF